MAAVNESIRKKRKELGMTQRQFAAYCDISLSTLRNIEQGRCIPGVKVATKIVYAVKLSFHDVLIGYTSQLPPAKASGL